MCAVLMKTMCDLKVCYSVAQGFMKVSSSKNGRFRYETIGETPRNGIVIGSNIYLPLFAKCKEFNRWNYMQLLLFSKKDLPLTVLKCLHMQYKLRSKLPET